jgi:hypothetical protein
MQEIDEGLWHWTATHPRVGWEVSSYYLSNERMLIDPLLPPGGLDWSEEIGSPRAHVLLSRRHHDRAVGRSSRRSAPRCTAQTAASTSWSDVAR